MTFKSKTERRPVKQYEGANPGAPRTVVQAVMATMPGACLPRMVPKPGAAPRPPRDPAVAHGNAIKDSARGEECTVRLEGVCSFDATKTIWSHARWGAQLGVVAGRGMSSKALDVCGAYACTDCDAVYDGQRSWSNLTRQQIDLDWCLGHFRSLGRLSLKGLL